MENQLTGEIALHLTVDTGMGRIGFQTAEEVLCAVDQIDGFSGFLLEGIFTHFATADELDETYFEKQNQRFVQVVEQLPYRPRYVHGSNSATALWHQDPGNLVRLGIAMYGQNPSGGVLTETYPLQAAMSLESALVQVKEVPAGEGIGYGKTYETTNSEWIATVPIGYADGFVRGMQGFKVLVEGHYCEIVGRVCMDQLMIRLPKYYPEGTPVTFIGRSKDKVNRVEDMAKHCDTIPHEITCGFSNRLPLYYY